MQGYTVPVSSISILITILSGRKLRNRRVPNGMHSGVRGRQANESPASYSVVYLTISLEAAASASTLAAAEALSSARAMI